MFDPRYDGESFAADSLPSKRDLLVAELRDSRGTFVSYVSVGENVNELARSYAVATGRTIKVIPID
jgi:hypothetical protein